MDLKFLGIVFGIFLLFSLFVTAREIDAEVTLETWENSPTQINSGDEGMSDDLDGLLKELIKNVLIDPEKNISIVDAKKISGGEVIVGDSSKTPSDGSDLRTSVSTDSVGEGKVLVKDFCPFTSDPENFKLDFSNYSFRESPRIVVDVPHGTYNFKQRFVSGDARFWAFDVTVDGEKLDCLRNFSFTAINSVVQTQFKNVSTGSLWSAAKTGFNLISQTIPLYAPVTMLFWNNDSSTTVSNISNRDALIFDLETGVEQHCYNESILGTNLGTDPVFKISIDKLDKPDNGEDGCYNIYFNISLLKEQNSLVGVNGKYISPAGQIIN